jgi:predicted metal-dependent phosphoesterase TrpH
MVYADLHLHTYYSDGTDSPSIVVTSARIKNLEMIAISDHDNLKGFYESINEVKKWGLNLVPGVEITTFDHHLLALGFNPADDEFKKFIDYSRDTQKFLCSQRVKILSDYGVPIKFEEVEKNFPNSTLGKYSIILTMLSKKVCREYLIKKHGDLNIKNIFKYYLSDKGIAGITEKKRWIDWEEAINEVHKASGLAIIAHPANKTNNPEKIIHLLKKVDGLEIQPQFGEQNDAFRKYAKDNGLLMSFGSDYHGSAFESEMLEREDNILSNDFLKRLKYII